MAKKNETTTYSVYVHRCPDGMVYVGSTSSLPCRRYNGGNGYKCNKEFYEAIQKWGWKNITHRVVMTCGDKETAKTLETVLICSVKREKSFNINSYSPNTMWGTVYDKVGVTPPFSSDLIVDAIGESADERVVNHYRSYEEIEKKFESYRIPPLTFGDVIEHQQKQSNMKDKEKIKTMVANFKVIKGVKIETVLDTRYKHNSGGYPVCVRLYKDRKYKYFGTGYVMTSTEFVDMNPKDEAVINRQFNYYCDKVRDCGETVTATDISIIPEYTLTLAPTFDGSMDYVFNEKMKLCTSLSSERTYQYTLAKINEAFPKGLKVGQISVETVSKFKDYLVTNGANATTINILLTNLKATINYGIYKGYIKDEQYPFKRTAAEIDKITLPKSKKRDTNYLTIDEVRKIWDWFMNSNKVNRNIGYFLFSYLHGGINLADMMFLRFDDFYYREGGFCYRRRKTEKKNDFNVVVPVTEWTKQLFQRMGIVEQRGELVFREMRCDGTDTNYNRVKASYSVSINNALKKVCGELGIHNVSMTTARHTFATIAAKNRMPFTMAESAMGHANNTVSSHYIGGFTVEEMRPDFEKML